MISALEYHFPPIHTKIILCFWHICKNVALHCKARFETADRWEDFIKGFRDVVQAKTEEDFDDILEEWKAEFHWNNGQIYLSTGPNISTEQALELADFELERQALVYCIGQWLTTYKTKIVYAWIDRYFHAGTRTTSRLEGGHHILKNWIGGPTGDLTRAWESTLLTIDIELVQISQKRSQELQSIPTALSS